MPGLRREWHRGPRSVVQGTDNRGRPIMRLGKRGGPVVEQSVELWLIPKERR